MPARSLTAGASTRWMLRPTGGVFPRRSCARVSAADAVRGRPVHRPTRYRLFALPLVVGRSSRVGDELHAAAVTDGGAAGAKVHLQCARSVTVSPSHVEEAVVVRPD